MLYLIGIGLSSFDDMSVRAHKIVQRCAKVYLEMYTSALCSAETAGTCLEGVEVVRLYRTAVESRLESLIAEAQVSDVALLVTGDPLFATTHTTIVQEAKRSSVAVEVVHAASIVNAIGAVGLYAYNYGATVSVTFCDNRSWFAKLHANMKNGLHTLCLFDIQVQEKYTGQSCADVERYMLPGEAMEKMLLYGEKYGHATKDTFVIVVSRFGSPGQAVVCGRIGELIARDFGRPLHCMIVPGALDRNEREAVAALFGYDCGTDAVHI